MKLEGKIAFVTGAGRGIGRACALELAKAGARVVLAARTEPEINRVAGEIEAMGREALALVVDLRDPSSLEEAFAKAIGRFAAVDILVNNAGIARSAPFQRWTDEMWMEVFEVNVHSVFRCTRAVLPGMLERGWGRVINIASVAGKGGAAYISGYAASKHAVLGMTKALAVEVADRGVTVNAICPGYVETDMARQAIDTIIAKTCASEEKARGFLESQTPQKRLFQVDEVAGMVLYLASDTARGINGQAINICGGALPY